MDEAQLFWKKEKRKKKGTERQKERKKREKKREKKKKKRKKERKREFPKAHFPKADILKIFKSQVVLILWKKSF